MRAALNLMNMLGGRARDHVRAAYVRALVDEIERHHPSEPCIPQLHEQLGEELERLASASPRKQCDLPPLLVVDDDAQTRDTLAGILKTLGYPVHVAEDAFRALAIIESTPVSIVISDWTMPGMSGLELCVKLKAMPVPPYVILMTAFADNERLLEGVREGVDDFLRKPIDIVELEVRVQAGTRVVRAIEALLQAT